MQSVKRRGSSNAECSQSEPPTKPPFSQKKKRTHEEKEQAQERGIQKEKQSEQGIDLKRNRRCLRKRKRKHKRGLTERERERGRNTVECSVEERGGEEVEGK
jgi:hypothetical protein